MLQRLSKKRAKMWLQACLAPKSTASHTSSQQWTGRGGGGVRSGGRASRYREHGRPQRTEYVWYAIPFITLWAGSVSEISLVSNYRCILSLLFSQQREKWVKELKREKMKLVNPWFRKLINSFFQIRLHSKNIALEGQNSVFKTATSIVIKIMASKFFKEF